MSTKALFAGALVVTLLSFCTAQAQSPAPPPQDLKAGDALTTPAPAPGAAPAAAPAEHHRFGWDEPISCAGAGHAGCAGGDCDGPIGANGPLHYEAYLRSGVDFPFGGGYLARTLGPGWVIEGGVRTLFFNPSLDAAWTIDVGISNVINDAPSAPSTLIVAPISATASALQPVTPQNLNRTFANLALGREWYVSGTVGDPDPTWRAGFDVGGRWGTEKLKLAEIQHKTEVIGGVFVSGHADVEFPYCGCCFFGGLRVEWGYTFAHKILQGNDTNIQDISLMLEGGVRF
jgi:hypothetical protein